MPLPAPPPEACSPAASYVTGHTMVVDGATGQRHLLLPEFAPIREQLGRGPFGSPRGEDR